MIHVFRSVPEALRQFVSDPVPFPVLADPERKAYTLYGVGSEGWLGLLRASWKRGQQARRAGHKVYWREALREGFLGNPADFLIGPDGRIERAHYGAHVADSLQPDQVLAWLS